MLAGEPVAAGTELAKGVAVKRFACSSVVPGCNAQWERPTDDEILSAMARHAATAHGLSEIPAELAAHVKSKISTVA
ncbi:MAG: hypothetical protein JWL70_366 [Acidimicrobiia bacterium]|nr:hypothetical protein [Acidimicrobiia bacterium]